MAATLADLWRIGGGLRDSNGDGRPDGVRVRVQLTEEPTAEEWAGLIEFCARLGLETEALSWPLVTTGRSSSPWLVRLEKRQLVEGQRATLRLQREGRRWVLGVFGSSEDRASALRFLARADLPEATELELDPSEARPDPTFAGRSSSELEGLEGIFEIGGLLTDFDGDGLPDGSRCCFVIPAPGLPMGVGVALCHLAARLGLESGGLCFPLAMVEGSPADAVALRVRLGDERPAVCRLDADGLVFEGTPEGVAELVEYFARRWPRLGSNPSGDIHQWLDDLTAAAGGLGGLGLAAATLAELENLRLSSRPKAFKVRTRFGAPWVERLRRLARVPVEPAERLPVFRRRWSDEPETARVIRVVREVVAGLGPGQEIELEVYISRPFHIREELVGTLRSILAERGIGGSVRCRSAYKPARFWLLEEVLPQWERLPVEQVTLSARRCEPPGQERWLDLPQRWLQEFYPADELVAARLNIPLENVRLALHSDGPLFVAEAFGPDGALLARAEFSPPVREADYLTQDPAAGRVHYVTGGVVARAGDRLEVVPVETDRERFWSWYRAEVLPAVCDYIRRAGQDPDGRPAFERLEVEVWLCEEEGELGLREERTSAAEALHEDIYFTTLDELEAFGRLTLGRPVTGPGGIVPLVHVDCGRELAAEVRLYPYPVAGARLERPDGTALEIGFPEPDPGRLRLKVRTLSLEAGRIPAVGLEITGLREGTERAAARLEAACRLQGGRGVQIHLNGRPIGRWPTASGRPSVMVEEPSGGAILDDESLPGALARLTRRKGLSVWEAGRSFEGRPIYVVELMPPLRAALRSKAKAAVFRPTVLFVGRHHANEVSSTSALVRLLEILTGEWPTELIGRLNVVVIPLENPDGAALHRRLRVEHPKWKHHAARYNAAGREFALDFSNPGAVYGEARVRPRLVRTWQPDVIVDNHGVPSHEWDQPFAGGGSPPRFPVSYWIPQALLYGIVLLPEGESPDRPLPLKVIRDIAQALTTDEEISRWNLELGLRYSRWGHAFAPERFPQEYHDNWLCFIRHRVGGPSSWYLTSDPGLSLVLITEAADETAQGDHLERCARAHQLADLAVLKAVAEAETAPQRFVAAQGAILRRGWKRPRPLRFG